MDSIDLLSEVNEAFSEGEAALEEKRFAEAIMAFRSGIRSLGDHYRHSGSIDSTSTREMLASVEEKQGNLSPAAYLLRTVLATRRSLFERKLADAAKQRKDDR
jgi:hypothetical protein